MGVVSLIDGIIVIGFAALALARDGSRRGGGHRIAVPRRDRVEDRKFTAGVGHRWRCSSGSAPRAVWAVESEEIRDDLDPTHVRADQASQGRENEDQQDA